ncbi:UDP-N-acetylmuramoyl-tripeptide--D-alanyl-D-alanine ligase [Tractidigestivibacter sp.]|uniref:UDP-N-acetylmuramoyl-tripeptide--D-alanyl-D- alanine ligase n=1 Tax=Tractidigestivibacter sp. TaxID=2847320 RepID=UPI002A91C6F6|nr:UDP-N-acetylmuramoyl-tripeptide--D-alanyl-D-alanine ligase [Tractidigestivibacter sp.]MDY5271598.1 UDP-N-acetylmuramoyl-tripeptide--D-alanyl-D-alanine ligase [Tractidigestivibacter sp.]
MLSMDIADLVLATGSQLLEGAPSARVEGTVEIDSRKAGPGSVFVAFAGERVDGNDFASAAVEAGAACVVVTREPGAPLLSLARERGCAVVRPQLDDAEEFLLRLAHEWRARHPGWLVVGVTGSVGKTTTKDLLRAGIASARRVHATQGNLNNLIGLPLTVLSAPDDAEVLVCEMGMNHPGEIRRMAACCAPTLAVITNVGTSHIGLLGSREGIARAKAEVVSGMVASCGMGPLLVLTSANDYTPLIADGFARPAGVAVAYVGERDGDDVRATGVELAGTGAASFTVTCKDGWSRRVTPSVPGRQVVPDFLLAMAVVDALGLDRDAAADAMAAMPATSMRLAVSESPRGVRVIDDSYNASPSSMAAALDVLSEMDAAGMRVAVLGEMGELGREERRLHGYVGAYAAAKGLDMLVFVGGELAGEMAEAARTMGASEDRLQLFPTADTAVETLAPVFSRGDLVLVKASRSCGLDAFARGVLR